MKKQSIRSAISAGLTGLALMLMGPVAEAADAKVVADGKALLQTKCQACHIETDAGLSRISQQRKSPEGWLMSIARMQVVHGIPVTNDERRTLVKYLSDTQGLAPSETEGVRYALERRLNTVESFESEQFTQMCARCHSGARVLLQRRPAAEWEHLVHFHLGQFPTTEYQAMGRDRDWLGIALKEMVPDLARRLPLQTDAWTQWQARKPEAVDGNWGISGHLSGRGGFSGVMTVARSTGGDRHAVTIDGRWDDGKPLKGKGQALIYTGYEWRADLDIDGTKMRQVMALDQGVLRGRMFQREHDEVGADVVASRQSESNARVLAVHPAYLKAGEEAELRIIGSGLKGDVQLPSGLTVVKTVQRSGTEVVLRVRATDAARGVHPVKVGTVSGGSLAVYDNMAAIKVLPAMAVARVGGNGTSLAKVEARFSAEAWDAGPDGKPGSDDDFRIGLVPATWSLEPFDEISARDEDVKFAGLLDAETGVFVPGDAGPNPARRMSSSNVGNLKVIAAVKQGPTALRGEGQLIVAPQRWNNPPIP